MSSFASLQTQDVLMSQNLKILAGVIGVAGLLAAGVGSSIYLGMSQRRFDNSVVVDILDGDKNHAGRELTVRLSWSRGPNPRCHEQELRAYFERCLSLTVVWNKSPNKSPKTEPKTVELNFVGKGDRGEKIAIRAECDQSLLESLPRASEGDPLIVKLKVEERQFKCLSVTRDR